VDGLVRDCVGRLSAIVLQVRVGDRWEWKLHSSHIYTIQSTYNYLIAADIVSNEGFDHVLWLKEVPLKGNNFVWRLFLNRLQQKTIYVGDMSWKKPNLFVRHLVVG
jgi:hypothetical protein